MNEFEPAYVLHSRPYRETSSIVEFLGASAGRFSLVVRGARGKKSQYRSWLQPFQPVLVSAIGRSELRTLTHLEANGEVIRLNGDRLYCGLYVNEVLTRVIHSNEACQQVWKIYENALENLASDNPIEATLRAFEINLLSAVGYGINFSSDSDLLTIDPNVHYMYLPLQGFVRVSPENDQYHSAPIFKGSDILSIGNFNFEDSSVLRNAKLLCRLALREHLGNKPLNSRLFFQSPKN